MFAFAASNSLCCACYELEFLDHSLDDSGQRCDSCSSYDGQLAGQKLHIQVVNSGGDLSPSHFDLMIPGGGMGIFNGLVSSCAFLF